MTIRRTLLSDIVEKNVDLSTEMFRLVAGIPEQLDRHPVFTRGLVAGGNAIAPVNAR